MSTPKPKQERNTMTQKDYYPFYRPYRARHFRLWSTDERNTGHPFRRDLVARRYTIDEVEGYLALKRAGLPVSLSQHFTR